MLSERAAWTVLAKAWERAKDDGDGYHRSAPIGRDHGAVGLCSSVIRLYDQCRVTGKIANLMDARIQRELDRRSTTRAAQHLGMFGWTTGKAGARARARFCRAQAAELAARRGR